MGGVEALRAAVWLLYPDKKARSKGLMEYLELGLERKVPDAYKCTVRDPWWRPPVVPVPDCSSRTCRIDIRG